MRREPIDEIRRCSSCDRECEGMLCPGCREEYERDLEEIRLQNLKEKHPGIEWER